MKQAEPDRQSMLQPLIAGTVVFIFLAWLAAVPMPYEQDEIAKAGKILFLQQNGHLFQPLAGQGYYHDEMFTLYYMVETWLHAVLHGNVFREMNLSSAVAGGIFCTLISTALRRVFLIPVWLTALFALNTPVFLQVFSFGNEAAFALVAFSATLLLLVQPTPLRSVVAGIVFGLGIHCRPDLVFLAPFLFAWSWLRGEKASRTGRLKAWICFAAAAGIVGLGYWLIFVRRMPTETGFEFKFVPQYFAAILFYPFAPVLIPAAVIGIAHLFRNRLRYFLVLSLTLIPLIYSARMLSSPKFAAITILPLWIGAGIGLVQRGWRLRTATFLLAAIFWMFSITPFGIYFGTRGTAWYLPTDDGPIPTGSYVCFYKNVHAGFYQQRYILELKQMEQLLHCLDEKPQAAVVGFLDSQGLLYAQAEQSRFNETLAGVPWLENSVATNRPCLLIKTSYLRINTLSIDVQKILRQWLAAGQVRPVVAENGDPFPDVIETDEQIPPGENPELGRRILFAIDRTHGNGYIRREHFMADLSATSWIPASEKLPSGTTAEPAYIDSAYAGYTNDIGGGKIYSSVMPLRYYGIKDPRINSGFASDPKK